MINTTERNPSSPRVNTARCLFSSQTVALWVHSDHAGSEIRQICGPGEQLPLDHGLTSLLEVKSGTSWKRTWLSTPCLWNIKLFCVHLIKIIKVRNEKGPWLLSEILPASAVRLSWFGRNPKVFCFFRAQWRNSMNLCSGYFANKWTHDKRTGKSICACHSPFSQNQLNLFYQFLTFCVLLFAPKQQNFCFETNDFLLHAQCDPDVDQCRICILFCFCGL